MLTRPSAGVEVPAVAPDAPEEALMPGASLGAHAAQVPQLAVTAWRQRTSAFVLLE